MSNRGRRKDDGIPGRNRLLDLTKHHAELFINGKQRVDPSGVYTHKLAPHDEYRHPHRMIYKHDELIAHVWCRTGKDIPGGKDGDWEVFIQEEP